MKNLLRDKNLILPISIAFVVACCSVTNQKRDTIIFSHHVHFEQGLECDGCHGDINKDAERKIQPLLTMDGCADCHDVEDSAQCGTCHTNTDAPDTYDRPGSTHLLFSHQKHMDYSSGCEDCHVGASGAADISPENRMIPQHLECNNCHQSDMDSGKCQLCHERLDLYQRKPETIFSHEANFFKRHGAKAAAGGQENCAVCHDQSFCGDCHAKTMTVRPSLRFPERVDRTFVHQGDWMSRHAIEARVGDTSCMKCHGTSFCSSCHEQRGVGGATGTKSPHPANWMTPGTATSHSRAARRRINECASCHDQGAASNCVHCHQSGGVNPHPPGWKAPVSKSERSSNQMCKICHSN